MTATKQQQAPNILIVDDHPVVRKGIAASLAVLAGLLLITAGRRMVEMVREDLRPSAILTRQAFENAITVDMAVGGSTNAVVHLLAIAGRTPHTLVLDDFDAVSRSPASE